MQGPMHMSSHRISYYNNNKFYCSSLIQSSYLWCNLLAIFQTICHTICLRWCGRHWEQESWRNCCRTTRCKKVSSCRILFWCVVDLALIVVSRRRRRRERFDSSQESTKHWNCTNWNFRSHYACWNFRYEYIKVLNGVMAYWCWNQAIGNRK